MPNEPVKLSEASIQQGNAGTVKPVFSASGFRTPEGVNILYLGIHGDTIRLCLSNDDVLSVMEILSELQQDDVRSRNVGTKPQERRAYSH